MAFSTINHLSRVYWIASLAPTYHITPVTPLTGSLNELLFYKTINVFILIYRILWGLSVKNICICLCYFHTNGMAYAISSSLLYFLLAVSSLRHLPIHLSDPFSPILIFWSCLLKHKALCGKTLLEVYRGQILPHSHSTITV